MSNIGIALNRINEQGAFYARFKETRFATWVSDAISYYVLSDRASAAYCAALCTADHADMIKTLSIKSGSTDDYIRRSKHYLRLRCGYKE